MGVQRPRRRARCAAGGRRRRDGWRARRPWDRAGRRARASWARDRRRRSRTPARRSGRRACRRWRGSSRRRRLAGDAGDGQAHRAGGEIVDAELARHIVLDAQGAEEARADEEAALRAGDGGDAVGQADGRLVGEQRRTLGRRGNDGDDLGALGGRRGRLGRLGRVGRLVERRRRQIGLERDGARADDEAAMARSCSGDSGGGARSAGGCARGYVRRRAVEMIAGADQRARAGAGRPLDAPSVTSARRSGSARRRSRRRAGRAGPSPTTRTVLVDGDHAAHDVGLAALRGAVVLDLFAAAQDAQDAAAAGADPDGVAEAGRQRGDAGVGEVVLPLAGAQAGRALRGRRPTRSCRRRRGRSGSCRPGAPTSWSTRREAARQPLGRGEPGAALRIDADGGDAIGGQAVLGRHQRVAGRLPSAPGRARCRQGASTENRRWR